jgi:hypothetical protein
MLWLAREIDTWIAAKVYARQATEDFSIGSAARGWNNSIHVRGSHPPARRRWAERPDGVSGVAQEEMRC